MKTYPVTMTDEEHKKLKVLAAEEDTTIKALLLQCIVKVEDATPDQCPPIAHHTQPPPQSTVSTKRNGMNIDNF